MKTSTRHPTTPGVAHSHSHTHSHLHSVHSPNGSRHHNNYTHSHNHSHHHHHAPSSHNAKSTKSTTPVTSPHGPFSVGQNHPPSFGQHPKLSPGRSHETRSSSPNYFGLVIESKDDVRDSSGVPAGTWSPSSSSIKSFGAALPKQVPLDANPDFEAFKRQADLNRGGKSSGLASAHFLPSTPKMNSPAPIRPRPSRWHTHASDSRPHSPYGRAPGVQNKDRSTNKMDADHDSSHDSAYVSADSKRNSESSLLPKNITSQPIHDSPRPMDPSQQYRGSLTRAEDRDPRLSVMEHKIDPPSPHLESLNRAATLPPSIDATQPSMISGAELKDLLEAKSKMLLLDIRSGQNFAQSRIHGALNLCIPTTLLKRATFNIKKLQQTFQQGSDSESFSTWRDMEWIVVYDSHSSEKRDATTAQNMIKKFTNEGYAGQTCILRGGFSMVQDRFPELIDHTSPSQKGGESNCTTSGGGGLAPVIGGVSLPTSGNDFNPFFSNIRQNMDLADGVGQFDVTRPNGLDSPPLPHWLREAASQSDHGKKVSERFLNIERTEQSRMNTAYSAFNVSDPSKSRSRVQLCGVEKGVKNRYKDILPFEHARVRLQNKPPGSCDYINASHMKSSRSNKRYIATQGPLPATFEDFWSVIWEQDVRVIVMLTAESEGGQLKCHSYWQGRDYGQIKLKPLGEKKVSLDIDKHRADSTMTPSNAGDMGRRRANTTTSLESSTPTPQSLNSQSETPYAIIRKFALSHAAHPFAPIREITHLHFPAWPDFGTPAQPSHLLALVEMANVMQRAALPIHTASVMESGKAAEASSSYSWFDQPETDTKARPMLVHCSAGCGRTGTFCTVDSVIDMLKRQRQDQATSTKPKDSEGDVAMTDDDAISPLTNRKMSFQWAPQPPKDSSDRRGSDLSSPGIDMSWLNDGTVDLISRTVEDFREQRLSMVQSLRQFVLCYETVLEWVHRIQERTAIRAVAGRARSGSLQPGLRDQ